MLLHSSGWLHENLRTSQILLFSRLGDGADVDDHASLEALLTGFDFARENEEESIEKVLSHNMANNLYLHPQISQGCVDGTFAEGADESNALEITAAAFRNIVSPLARCVI